MLKTIVDIIGCLPLDIEMERKLEEYFASKPFKTKKLYEAMEIAYIVMKSNKTDESDNFLPVCVFDIWEKADALLNECTKYNETAPQPPEGDAAAWEAFGNTMDEWRNNHPLKKYNQKCKVKTTDYYSVVVTPVIQS